MHQGTPCEQAQQLLEVCSSVAAATGVTTKVASRFTDRSLGGVFPLAPERNSD